MMRFYGNRLKLDTGKAAQVMAIQETYKTGLKQLVARNPSEQQYRQAVAALMAEKNRQLAQLLTPEQQAMIIPTTERKPAQPAVTKH
jgi:hypothetical protein